MGALFHVRTATLVGVDAVPVDAEVDIGPGLPGIFIVGMADIAVQEARQRVRSALRSCGFKIPDARIVVNLAPGQLRKSGSGFDLPIAVALLCATGQIAHPWVDGSIVVGELGLDGSVKGIRGLLAYALAAKAAGLSLVCAPEPSLARLDGVDVLGIEHLSHLRQSGGWSVPYPSCEADDMASPDFSDIAGEEVAKRAMQIAAAGRHGLLMIGPPGSGKSMLAHHLPTILPPLSDEEMCESALIHSVAGLPTDGIFAGRRPFRSPHHSASTVGLIGGGSPIHPGEASLAHNGVLFLDEMPEFAPSALQALRQPLEDGTVTIVRSDCSVRFPASFMLVGAANPCPCGYLGDPDRPCTCSEQQVSRYQARIGGPLMDRIDIVCNVWRADPRKVLQSGSGRSSAELFEGVMRARERSEWRAHRMPMEGGSKQKSAEAALVEECMLSEADHALYCGIAAREHLSGRAIIRTLRVARTIADLDGADQVCSGHLMEALAFRVREGGQADARAYSA